MGPHPNDFDGPDIIQNLIDQAVLDIDPARAGSRQIADQALVWRGTLVRIRGEQCQKAFCLGLEPRSGKSLGVSPRLGGIDESPLHQSRYFLHLSTGVFSPLRIDSLMPEMAFRYKVS